MADGVMRVFGKSANKGQIALEFAIVYSFILVVFLIVFALIVTQRGTTLANQQLSSLQLVSQNVAAYLDQAVFAGTGYNATISLPPSIGGISYNVTVSTTGVVIAKAKVGSQVLTAQAYSSARNLVIGGNVLPQSANGISLYLLNSYQGGITVQNLNGVVYVNMQPPSAISLASSASIGVTALKVADFLGSVSYVRAGQPGVASSLNAYPITISVWLNSASRQWGDITQKGSLNSPGVWEFDLNNDGNPICGAWNSSSFEGATFTGYNVPLNGWVQLACIIKPNSPSGSVIDLYVNGSLSGTATTTLAPGSTDTGVMVIGGDGRNGFFNGEMSNLQIYNGILTAPQLFSLYQGGLSAAPANTNSLIGWWPLNGNANDYSGMGNSGGTFGAVYTGLARLNVAVKSAAGSPVSNALVSITSPQSFPSEVAQFNGAGGYSYVGMPAGVYFTGPFSVTAWVYLKSCNSWERIIDFGQGTDYNNILWAGSAGTSCEPLLQEFNGAAGSTEDFATTLSLNTWYFLAATYDGTYIRQYENGALAPNNGMFTAGVSLPAVTRNDNFIGRSNWPQDSAFNGLISNVQLYNSVLTGTQISSLYGEGITGAPLGGSSLIDWWPLNGNATNYYNSSASGASFNVVYVNAANALSFPTSIGGTIGYNTITTGSNGDASAFIGQNYSSTGTTLNINVFTGNSSTTGNLVGWWPLNEGSGTATYDGSGHGATGTFNNAIWSPSYPNQTNFMVGNFDGNYKYSNTLSSASLNPTNGLTIAAWVRYVNAGHEEEIFSRWPCSTPNGNTYVLGVGGAYTAGNLFAKVLNSAATQYIIQDSMAMPTSTWTFVSLTYNQSYLTLYMNGAAVNSIAVTGQITSSPGVPDFIGGIACSGNLLPWDGSIANVQVYNASLPKAAIRALFARGLNGMPYTNGTVAGWWPLNGNANDALNNTPPSYSNVVYTNVNYVNYGSANIFAAPAFNTSGSTSSYIAIPNTATTNFNNGKTITIDAWVRPVSYNTLSTNGDPYLTIVTKAAGYYLQVDNSGHIGAALENVSGYFPSVSALPLDTWSNVAFVWDGATQYIYINGRLDSSGTLSGLIKDTSGDYLGIGANLGPGGGLYSAPYNRFFHGQIADVFLYKGALSQQQVQQIYSEGINATPPTTSNLVGWWPLNGNANDYSGNDNTGAATGVSYIPVSGPSNSTGVPSFDGQAGYVMVPYSASDPLFSLSNTLTFSAWVYPIALEGTAADGPIFERQQCNHAYPYEEFNLAGSSPKFDLELTLNNANAAGGITFTASKSVPQGAWSLVTATYNKSKQAVDLYVDGKNVASGTYANSIYVGTDPFFIGGIPSAGTGCWYSYLYGSITGAQVYNTDLTANQVTQLYLQGRPAAAQVTIPFR